MEQLWHYCCPACGKSFVDGPYWKANTNHSCPGRNGQMISLVSSYNVLKAIPATENKLPWSERVNMISVNPHAASLNDIHRMAAELSEFMRGERGIRPDLKDEFPWASGVRPYSDLFKGGKDETGKEEGAGHDAGESRIQVLRR